MGAKFDPVFTVAEVASILKVTPQVVYKHIKLARIQAFRFGSALRITKAEVDRLFTVKK